MIHQIGKHRVRQGDMMDLPDDLFLEKVDMVYSDPPWGEGNLKFWATYLKKTTGLEHQQPTLISFLHHLFRLFSDWTNLDALVFIEYGVRWNTQIIAAGQAVGFTLLDRAEPVYGSKNYPLYLYCFAKKPFSVSIQRATGTKGFQTLESAAGNYCRAGGILFDPCCGKGYSAQLAVNHGMTFYGNELNPVRLAHTLKRLS
jgi:hypothetical protein